MAKSPGHSTASRASWTMSASPPRMRLSLYWSPCVFAARRGVRFTVCGLTTMTHIRIGPIVPALSRPSNTAPSCGTHSSGTNSSDTASTHSSALSRRGTVAVSHRIAISLLPRSLRSGERGPERAVVEGGEGVGGFRCRVIRYELLDLRVPLRVPWPSRGGGGAAAVRIARGGEVGPVPDDLVRQVELRRGERRECVEEHHSLEDVGKLSAVRRAEREAEQQPNVIHRVRVTELVGVDPGAHREIVGLQRWATERRVGEHRRVREIG